MRNALGRLVLWMAEILDRSLITVPDLDLDDAYSPSPLSQIRTPTMSPAITVCAQLPWGQLRSDDRCSSQTGIAGTRR
jgi:hypothetical protein